MKFRNSFVSNSSSCSFILLAEEVKVDRAFDAYLSLFPENVAHFKEKFPDSWEEVIEDEINSESDGITYNSDECGSIYVGTCLGKFDDCDCVSNKISIETLNEDHAALKKLGIDAKLIVVTLPC